MEPLKNQPRLICHLVSNRSPSVGFNPVTGDSSSVWGWGCADPHLIPAKVAFSRRKKGGDCAKKAPFQLHSHECSGQECSLMLHSPKLPRTLWQQNQYITHHPFYQVILWLWRSLYSQATTYEQATDQVSPAKMSQLQQVGSEEAQDPSISGIKTSREGELFVQMITQPFSCSPPPIPTYS